MNDDNDGTSLPFAILLQEEDEEEKVDEKVEKGEETMKEQQLQHYVVHTSTPDPTTLTIRQLPSQGLSFQLWPAASALVSFLNQLSSSNNPFLSAISERPIRILELGSGTGLVGIAAAAIFGAHVTLTDLPHVLPNIQFNADANARAIALNGGTIDICPLRWGEPEDLASAGKRFHLLLASDVVYHDHLFDPLLQTLRFFLQRDVALLMAHLRRWKKDSAFFKKARKLFEVPYSGSFVMVGILVNRITSGLFISLFKWGAFCAWTSITLGFFPNLKVGRPHRYLS